MRHPSLVAAVLVTVGFLSCTAIAQQMNTLNASLSVNGTGLLDETGAVYPSNSNVFPTPAGSAPFFHHKTAPGISLEFRIDGPELLPIILVAGTPAAPTPVGSYFFDLDLAAPLPVLADGTAPTNFVNLSAFTDADGTWRYYLPQGLPPNFPAFTLQGIIVDNTTPPIGLRFTAAITVEVDSSLETFAKNIADGLNYIVGNPNYVKSCLATDFLLDGMNRDEFMALQTLNKLFFDELGFITHEAMGPNLPNAPALSTSGPSLGESVTGFVQHYEIFADDPCVPGEEIAERYRGYDLEFVEEGFVWKLRGNQQDVAIITEIYVSPGASNPQGLDTFLNVWVEDSLGKRGGVASVDLTGPQLANIGFGGAALTAASGTQQMSLGAPTGLGTEWFYQVQLADTTVGSSRLPLIADATGARDEYTVVVHWNDGSTSGPYTVPLRGSIDISANPGDALAAMPALVSAPTASLNMGGTAGANVNVAVHAGSLPADVFSLFQFAMFQGPESDVEFFPNNYVPGTTLMFNQCAPGFSTGVATSFSAAVFDIIGMQFATGGLLNL